MKPLNIEYLGPWEDYMCGPAIAVRRHVQALSRAGHKVCLRSICYTNTNFGTKEVTDFRHLPEPVLSEVGPFTNPSTEPFNARVVHVQNLTELRNQTVPSEIAQFSQFAPNVSDYRTERLRQMNSMTACFFHMEHEALPSEAISGLETFAQVWVPGIWQVEKLINHGLPFGKVHVVPHPMGLRDPIRRVVKKKPDRQFVFLNIGTWTERKRQDLLLLAFLTLFRPRDNVRLLIKSNSLSNSWPDQPRGAGPIHWVNHLLTDKSDEARAVQSMGWNHNNIGQHVQIRWNQILSRLEVVNLYAEADVYVSAGEAEAYDLCAFDARMALLPIVFFRRNLPEYALTSDLWVKEGECSLPIARTLLNKATKELESCVVSSDCRSTYYLDSIGERMSEIISRIP